MKTTVLENLYEQAIDGLPIIGTPQRMRDTIAGANGVDEMIALYASLGGLVGFTLGLPGYLFMPVTVPADIAANATLQIHLCAAVALFAGEDLASPETRRRILRCVSDHLDEDEPTEFAERTGIKLGERGVRFLTENSLKSLGRAGGRGIPILGGLLGAGTNSYATLKIGRAAVAEFLSSKDEVIDVEVELETA